MDDGMKRVSRERLEPALKLHKNMNYNMIRNWTGESTEEVFYELCDEYGMLVMNDFWLSTDGFNLNPLDNCLFVRNDVVSVITLPSLYGVHVMRVLLRMNLSTCWPPLWLKRTAAGIIQEIPVH